MYQRQRIPRCPAQLRLSYKEACSQWLLFCSVLLYFVLFAFSGLRLVFVVCLVFDSSSVTYFPACTNVNGTVLMRR